MVEHHLVAGQAFNGAVNHDHRDRNARKLFTQLMIVRKLVPYHQEHAVNPARHQLMQ